MSGELPSNETLHSDRRPALRFRMRRIDLTLDSLPAAVGDLDVRRQPK